MPRSYTARARAESTARTRERIVASARTLLPQGTGIPVDRVAAAAGVSVQTLYTHFGSKRGLLLAVIDSAQRDAGTYADFDLVWQSPDGETALRRMLEATLRIWNGAWELVEFCERARRSDPEIARSLRDIDGYRAANLRSITDRLGAEGRLMNGHDPVSAADVAFALSTPAVYEELVRVRGWGLERAIATVSETLIRGLIDPTRPAVLLPPADWSRVLRPTDVVAAVPVSPRAAPGQGPGASPARGDRPPPG